VHKDLKELGCFRKVNILVDTVPASSNGSADKPCYQVGFTIECKLGYYKNFLLLQKTTGNLNKRNVLDFHSFCEISPKKKKKSKIAKPKKTQNFYLIAGEYHSGGGGPILSQHWLRFRTAGKHTISINQSIGQSSNQKINQSINQSINE
jgi:hypothetical protein